MRSATVAVVMVAACAAARADLPATEKAVAEARGLAWKSPLKTMPGKTLRYDAASKTLEVPAGVSGFDVAREVARALIDQHHDLTKLLAGDADAVLARGALVEGDVLLTAAAVDPAGNKALTPYRVPLAEAERTDAAFRAAAGLRYVEHLKARGGWKSVDGAYRFAPSSTAVILHPDDPPGTVDLGPGETVGEYHLADILRGKGGKGDPFAAVAGWCGGVRTGKPGDGYLSVAFTRPEQASAFAGAVVQAHAKAFTSAEPGVFAGTLEGRSVAVVVRDERVHLLDAPDEAGLKALRDRVDGPLRLRVFSAADKKEITVGELTDRLLAADAVCVGEDHDSDPVHRVQLLLVKELFARDERLGVGMEMFQRPYQDALDAYVRGDLAEDEMLRRTEYRTRWGYPWQLYRPVVRFCQRNGVPVAALNAPRELTRRLSSAGFDALTADEKRQLGPVDFDVKAHRDHWYEKLASMHGEKDVPAERKERSYRVMAAWDGVMANSAADFQHSRRLRRMVVLAGSGHVDRRFGIPDRLAKRTGGTVATVHVTVGSKPEEAFKEPVTDFVVLVE